jgi:hypothetical protein
MRLTSEASRRKWLVRAIARLGMLLAGLDYLAIVINSLLVLIVYGWIIVNRRRFIFG